MVRIALIACAVALFSVGGASQLGAAEESKPVQPESREEWREELLAANQRIAVAQKREQKAFKIYEKMRHRRRPRGDAKQAIMDELALAREELAQAELNLEKLEKAARRAGAQPSWFKFDPGEIETPESTPASSER